MFIYSEKIRKFINEIKNNIKHIISNEIGLKTHGDRFYNSKQTASYPIKIVIYNHKNSLGYFDSDFYELGFHECLMQTNKEQLVNIIRHELAHYMTYLEYGNTIEPHSTEFRNFCRLKGWGEEVYSATCTLETCLSNVHEDENSILRKVKKLMALAKSSNAHEAEQAMIKSQQLLLRHNIDSSSLDDDDDEKIHIRRILKQKKESAKMRAIARILTTFFVSTVYTRSEGYIYLEILGNAVNVEIAEYVAQVLETELEKLWHQAQYQANLRGMIAKNSFFLGIALGYCDKINALKKDYNTNDSQALMVIEKQLMDAQAMVYQRLTKLKSSGNHCGKSSSLGQQMGRQLNINPALGKSSGVTTALIG